MHAYTWAGSQGNLQNSCRNLPQDVAALRKDGLTWANKFYNVLVLNEKPKSVTVYKSKVYLILMVYNLHAILSTKDKFSNCPNLGVLLGVFPSLGNKLQTVVFGLKIFIRDVFFPVLIMLQNGVFFFPANSSAVITQ